MPDYEFVDDDFDYDTLTDEQLMARLAAARGYIDSLHGPAAERAKMAAGLYLLHPEWVEQHPDLARELIHEAGERA